MPKIHFEDLKAGIPLPCRTFSLDRSEIIRFGKRYDPLPFHIDEEAARSSLFGGLIASSLHLLAACTRVVVEAQGEVSILSGLGIDEVKLSHPVRPGDLLSVRACWSDLRRSRSRPDRGIAGLRCTVTNQRGETVAEYGYRYLVACRNTV